MVEFSEGKFFPCRELFLTKSSVNRTECSVPFCDRGVFRMFISNSASCTYKNVYDPVLDDNRIRIRRQETCSVCSGYSHEPAFRVVYFSCSYDDAASYADHLCLYCNVF